MLKRHAERAALPGLVEHDDERGLSTILALQAERYARSMSRDRDDTTSGTGDAASVKGSS